jgi:hypothetical protein
MQEGGGIISAKAKILASPSPPSGMLRVFFGGAIGAGEPLETRVITGADKPGRSCQETDIANVQNPFPEKVLRAC